MFTSTMENAVNAVTTYISTSESAFEALLANDVVADDCGGVVMYYTGSKLAAFYDYDFGRGHIFANPVA